MQETIRVDRDLSEIRHVRAWMAGVLERAEVADGLVDDVLLMVSELVTNVLRHTESAPEVQVEVAAGRIRALELDHRPRRDRLDGWDRMIPPEVMMSGVDGVVWTATH